MNNWRTTAAFAAAAIFQAVAQIWPQHAEWAGPAAQIATVLGGYAAADAVRPNPPRSQG